MKQEQRKQHTLMSHQRGSTLIGFIVGLVLGLSIALVVAVLITNAPVPFVNKVQRPAETALPTKDGKLPDPNKSLYGPDASKAQQAEANTTAPVQPAPAPTATAPANPDDGTRFLVQAGAFKTPEDADAMRARLAMLGLDARVFPVEQGGATLYRVRLGPYGQGGELSRVQSLLASNGVDNQVIRVK